MMEGGGQGGGQGDADAWRPCEDFLCASSINLLRGVTPPEGDACEDGAEGYGRYGHESIEERQRRVRARPPGTLWCMACATKYAAVAAAVDVCGSCGVKAATPDARPALAEPREA